MTFGAASGWCSACRLVYLSRLITSFRVATKLIISHSSTVALSVGLGWAAFWPPNLSVSR